MPVPLLSLPPWACSAPPRGQAFLTCACGGGSQAVFVWLYPCRTPERAQVPAGGPENCSRKPGARRVYRNKGFYCPPSGRLKER